MLNCIELSEMLAYLFDREEWVEKAERIIRGLLEARCARLSAIAEKMAGQPDTNYKMLQRFMGKVDLKAILGRLFQEEAEFVIGDPTEMPRPQAKKTGYVGRLSDGETLGYWLLVLATPFRGRAIPFHFISYSSQTIADQATSRNQEHFRAFAGIKAWLGERPLVLDREFSYLELLKALVAEKVHFVIRLKVGVPQVTLTDKTGQPIKLAIQPGKKVIYHQVWYKGEVPVNLIGIWQVGLSAPMWIMTDLEPERGLTIYRKRMKIEQSFRDCKDLLGLDRSMNKQQVHMEQMVALVLLAYVLALFWGEALRDVTYGAVVPEDITPQSVFAYPRPVSDRSKWKHYSGLFVLLKQRLRVSLDVLQRLRQPVAQAFALLVFGNVRSFV
jgi:hypothetical protein